MKEYEIKAILQNGQVVMYTKQILHLLLTDNFIVEIYDYKGNKLK